MTYAKKMKTLLLIAIVGSLIGLIGNVWTLRARSRERAIAQRDARDAKAIRELCRMTRHIHRFDATALRSDSPQTRDLAVRQIGYDAIYHGLSSVQICLGDQMPPIRDCYIEFDAGDKRWGCMSEQAAAFAAALERAP